MQENFFIKIIGGNGKSGWIINHPEGLFISDGYTAKVTPFDSWESANMFVKTHKLNEQQGIIVKIYSNMEIMDLPEVKLMPLTGTCYYLENDKGEKCCVSEMHEGGFYFKKCEVGYAVWEQPNHLTELRDHFINNGVYCDVKETKN